MKKFLRITGIVFIILLLGISALLAYVKFMLPNIGPAPEIKVVATPETIKRGAYLANHVAVCIDCHSTRDFSKFSGPVVPGSNGSGGEIFDQQFGFPGKFIARNITPHNLSSWSDGEIFRAITTGVNKDGKALFPVMPYGSYGQMHEDDVKSIIAYLRTLPAIAKEHPVSVPDFPMNFIINTIPKKAEPMAAVSPSDTVAYGKYITTIAGCAECHTKQEKGQIVGEFMAGGFEFKMADGSILRSANLTPHKNTGIGNWTADHFVERFKTYANGTPAVAKGEFNSIMPWAMYSGMDTTDLRAIYAYLSSIKEVDNIIEKYTAK
jgi:mono/diheme cytochrome c family protein